MVSVPVPTRFVYVRGAPILSCNKTTKGRGGATAMRRSVTEGDALRTSYFIQLFTNRDIYILRIWPVWIK